MPLLRWFMALPLSAAIIRILTPEEEAEKDEPWGTVVYKEADGCLVSSQIDGGETVVGNRSAAWTRFYGLENIEGDSIVIYLLGLAEICGEFFEETGKLKVTRVAKAHRLTEQEPDVFDKNGLFKGLEKWAGQEFDVTFTGATWKLEGANSVLNFERNTSAVRTSDYEDLLIDRPTMCSVTVHVSHETKRQPVDITTPHIKWYATDADNDASRDALGYVVDNVQCTTEVLVKNRDTEESVTCVAGTVESKQFPGWSVNCVSDIKFATDDGNVDYRDLLEQMLADGTLLGFTR